MEWCCLMGTEFRFGEMKSFGDGWGGDYTMI